MELADTSAFTAPASWTGPRTPYPRDATLWQLFAARARSSPSAPAAVHGDRRITYGELEREAERVAGRLVARGVGHGDVVGVCGARSIGALVALLGVTRVGAAYVPLDDALPPERVRAMADSTGVDVVVRTGDQARRLRAPRATVDVGDGPDPGTLPPDPASATDLASVMFTSGTSGLPKAVGIPHRGIVRLATGDPDLSDPGTDDRILFSCALSSDASTIEIWSALLNGACLVVVEHADLLSPPSLGAVLAGSGVTIAYLTTSVFHLVARSRPEMLNGLRFVSAGGEAMDPDLTRAVLTACPSTTVVNFYGPTENSVVSTAHVVRDVAPGARRIPIGHPIANSSVLVLGDDGTPTPPGSQGELFVGGDGLALGYLGDPEQTGRRFVDHPSDPGRRMYRTGDTVRVAADGRLDFVGRRDRQIKLRGHRIELGEVEARLTAMAEIGEAAVVFDGTGEVLVAHLTPAVPGTVLDLEAVRADLGRWLPDQSVPGRIAQRDQLPVGPSGKVDHDALVAESAADPAPPAPEIAGLRDTIAAIWRITLAVEPGPRDSFFDLGGDSVLASEAVIRTLAVLGLDHGRNSTLIRELLRNPTLDGFTGAVRAVRDGRLAEQGTVDLDADAELGFDLPPVRGRPPQWSRPREVLLTGATGFVGAFLLDQVLRTTSARVHLPVRAANPVEALDRVRATLRRYGLTLDDPGRVRAVPADIAEPRMGLPDAVLQDLTDRLDLILHPAAEVNFLYPYSALKAANVDGTREVLRVAAPRRVPVHFVSTVATLAGFGTAGVRTVDEDVDLDHGDHLTLGYAESKWVAEKMVLQAGAAGLPVAVYRPYEITGEQRTGACNVDTAICSLFRTIVETGVAPDIALPIDFVPVDYLAAAVLHIATEREPGRRAYHLTNPSPARLSDVLDRLRAAGCAIEMLPYARWVGELVHHVADNPRSPTAPFVPMCIDRSRGADMSVKEMYLEGTFPLLGRDNVDKDLADSGLRCPPVDAALLDLYLGFLFDCGYIRRPG